MNYNEQRSALIQYMQSRIDTRDWRSVIQAAVDLQVLEAKMQMIINSSKNNQTIAERVKQPKPKDAELQT